MKKKSVIAIAGMMSLWLAACGQAGGTQNVQTEPSVVETVQETQNSEETSAAEETQAAQSEASAESAVPAQTETPVQTEVPEETGGASETSSSVEQASGGYADNFAVDSAAAAEFAGKIKTAVAEKNMEKLADLTAFPVYVGFKDGGTPVESRDEFLALGADKIFTQELVDSVAAADENALSPSMAGFVLSDGSKANIIFAVNEGELTIVGINY